MLRIISLIVGAIIFICITIPLFLPNKFSMSRSIEIQAPLEIVFSKLTKLSEYDKWNPFPEGDPTNQTTISGEAVGSTLTWAGKKTGEGKMTIIGIDPLKKVEVKMEFYKPMTGEGVVQWITSAKSENTTELTWSFEQDLSYFNRYFGLIMDSMMGKHFEKGLKNFKTLVESSSLPQK